MATVNGRYRVWNAGTSTWDVVKLAAYDSDKLNGQLASHYLNYNNLSNKPVISTNITTDATSDVKTASPKAVKTYADGLVTNLNYNNLSNKPTIPTVPVISTNITTDATSNVKTASPKAVKTYADGLVTNLGKIKIGSTWYTATLSGTILSLSSS